MKYEPGDNVFICKKNKTPISCVVIQDSGKFVFVSIDGQIYPKKKELIKTEDEL